MFFAGLIICTVLIYIMSLFIWNIHIDGNVTHTDDVLLEYLESAGTYHGIRKNKVDCDQIVSDLRKEYSDIIWVSAEISGTRLIIKVKENSDTTETTTADDSSDEPADLVADKDGIITEIITRSGVPAVAIGDVVKAGDILISGRIEVLDDAGEVAEYQYSVADSDIYAKTVYDYEDTFPLDYTERQYTKQVKKGYYINILDRKIHLWSPDVDYEEYDIVTDENQWKLGEYFYLPISSGTISYSEYETKTERYDEAGGEAEAEARLADYLEELSKKGVQILENNVTILMDQDTCTVTGKIQVIEQIGVSKPTEILAAPEKEDEEGTNTDEYSGTDT